MHSVGFFDETPQILGCSQRQEVVAKKRQLAQPGSQGLLDLLISLWHTALQKVNR